MRLFSPVLPALAVAFSFVSATSAQCTRSSIGFMNIGIVPNNPFHAELVTKTEGALPHLPSGSLSQKPQLVARDSQGRVRIERVTGMYKMDSGPDQGQALEQHLISICDPVAQTVTQIDTINRSAKVTHFGPPQRLPGSLIPAQSSLCAVKSRLGSLANGKSEDLGNQTILGLEAHGTRLILTPSAAVSEGHSVTTTIQDQWCSDDLAAVLLTSQSFLQNNQTTRKSQTSLASLERTEPDAALFQIPPDYTISELVPNPAARRPGLHVSVQPLQIPSSPQK